MVLEKTEQFAKESEQKDMFVYGVDLDDVIQQWSPKAPSVHTAVLTEKQGFRMNGATEQSSINLSALITPPERSPPNFTRNLSPKLAAVRIGKVTDKDSSVHKRSRSKLSPHVNRIGVV
jgi:hypothetical protein